MAIELDLRHLYDSIITTAYKKYTESDFAILN